MTEDEAISEMVKYSWDQWVEAGGVNAVQEVLGMFLGERERRIFESGWKLGFEHSIQMARRLSEAIMRDEAGKN